MKKTENKNESKVEEKNKNLNKDLAKKEKVQKVAKVKKEKKPKKEKPEKEPKKVTAKKLPKLYKKSYTKTQLDKKIYKHLFIEKDRIFVEKLFDSAPVKTDKKGREIYSIDKNSIITAKDAKRYKELAKQIKAQKGGIKVVPLVAVVILIAGIGIGFTLFKNVIISKVLTSAMQGIFGAKTDIASVDFEFFGASLKIQGLEQANKDNTMRNLFEIDNIETSFDLTDLLRGKFHAENLAVEGVALDTERKTDGALPVKPEKTKEEKETESALNNKIQEVGSYAQNLLKDMFADYNPEKILADLQNELKSPNLATQISSEVQEKVTKWQAVPTELQNEITEFSNSVNTVLKTDYSNIKDVTKLKETLSSIENAIEKGTSLTKNIENTTKDIQSDASAVSGYAKQIENAINSDLNLVETKISDIQNLFSADGINEIMNGAIQTVLYDVCGKYYPYVSKALAAATEMKNSSSKNKDSSEDSKNQKKIESNTTRERLPGRNIQFRADTVPTLFIENVVASGYEYQTDNLLFKGTATDIANDQDVTGKPSVINATFNIQGNPNNAALTIDSRSSSNSPLVDATYTGEGFTINSDAKVFTLESKSKISAGLKTQKDGKTSINGVLDMNVTNMTGMDFEPARVCTIYKNALANVKALTIDFTATVGSDGFSLNLNNLEKLGTQLTTPIVKALTAELSVIAEDAKANVTTMLSEKTGIATEEIEKFTNIQSAITESQNKANEIQKQLEAKQKEITNQITGAAQKAVEETTNKAKEEVQKQAGNLLKGLF